MKTIVIEGTDKSGKATQSELLKERLSLLGYKVAKSEFHRYDTPTGELIMKWLTKQWDVDQTTIELIMAADKQSQQTWFNELEKDQCDFLVLDRYLLSQAAYGIANGMDGRWIVEMHKFMRYPHIDIVIDLPAEISMRRKGKHNNGNNDRYESNLEMLKRVGENYRNLSTYYSAPVRKIIDGTKSVEEIHNDIFQIVVDLYGGHN